VAIAEPPGFCCADYLAQFREMPPVRPRATHCIYGFVGPSARFPAFGKCGIVSNNCRQKIHLEQQREEHHETA
jgi:hypothetical protein